MHSLGGMCVCKLFISFYIHIINHPKGVYIKDDYLMDMTYVHMVKKKNIHRYFL